MRHGEFGNVQKFPKQERPSVAFECREICELKDSRHIAIGWFCGTVCVERLKERLKELFATRRGGVEPKEYLLGFGEAFEGEGASVGESAFVVTCLNKGIPA
jgi:hypothetical protein